MDKGQRAWRHVVLQSSQPLQDDFVDKIVALRPHLSNFDVKPSHFQNDGQHCVGVLGVQTLQLLVVEFFRLVAEFEFCKAVDGVDGEGFFPKGQGSLKAGVDVGVGGGGGGKGEGGGEENLFEVGGRGGGGEVAERRDWCLSGSNEASEHCVFGVVVLLRTCECGMWAKKS